MKNKSLQPFFIAHSGLLAAVADLCGWWLYGQGAKGFDIAQTFRVCVTWQIWLWVEEAMAANGHGYDQ